MTMAGPLPTQVCTWLSERSGYDGSQGDASESQWLYCLKDTQPGDRQAVWAGVHGEGIVAIVDFSGAVRRRAGHQRLYEGWGRIMRLPRPISVTVARSDPRLSKVFSGSIQSVKALDESAGAAIAELADGLPPAARFVEGEVDWQESGGDWTGERLPPEKITEEIVLDKARIARVVGFPSAVNPAGKKQRLDNGKYPDLWCERGVVGDVKSQVTASWGPDQLEHYIDQCNQQWPQHRWRGVLVQGEPEMAPNAAKRLDRSRHDVEVWRVARTGRLRRPRATKLYRSAAAARRVLAGPSPKPPT